MSGRSIHKSILMVKSMLFADIKVSQDSIFTYQQQNHERVPCSITDRGGWCPAGGILVLWSDQWNAATKSMFNVPVELTRMDQVPRLQVRQ